MSIEQSLNAISNATITRTKTCDNRTVFVATIGAIGARTINLTIGEFGWTISDSARPRNQRIAAEHATDAYAIRYVRFAAQIAPRVELNPNIT